MSFDPWRYACPEGHRTVRRLTGSMQSNTSERSDGYRCETCKRSYPGKPTDLKREA